MELDILEYLKSYESLKSLVGEDRYYPLFTTDISKTSIAYKFTPLIGGYIKQTQLDLKVILKDYDEVKAIEKIIIERLDMKADLPYVKQGNTYFKSSLSGGGILFNDSVQMYEDEIYFIINWR